MSSNVAILTQNEPFLINRLIGRLLSNQRDYNYNVKEIIIFESKRKGKTKIDWISERIALFRFSEVLFY